MCEFIALEYPCCTHARPVAHFKLFASILRPFFSQSEYIDDDGNVIKKPGAQYADNGVRLQY
eukprot:2824592-Pleurochrysis_carterae.AAC.1